MSKKTITLEHIGYTVGGQAELSLWGGGSGWIEMDKRFIPAEKLTKTNLLGCINDGQFGCQAITSVTMEIYDTYENSTHIYAKMIHLDEEDCLRYHKYFYKGIL